MIAFIFLIGMLFIYFIVISVILNKKYPNGNISIIAPPPKLKTSIEQKYSSTTSHGNIPPEYLSGNVYLQAIAEFLSEKQEEPLKILKFIESINSQEDKNFLLSYLKNHNIKLHDIIINLMGIDTENIESFKSSVIDIDPELFDQNIKPQLTIEEELVMGGLPYDFVKEEMRKNGFTDFLEFIEQLTETYISRTLSQLQIQEIEKIGEAILTAPTTKTIPSKELQHSFAQGEKIATEIQKEIENHNT